MNQTLPLGDIREDGGTQTRAALDEATIERYAQQMRDGEIFVPVDVYFDGESYWLADGFHRLAASRLAEIEEIDCLVHEGSSRAAILHAVGANNNHGLPRSNLDKRHAIAKLLRDEEWVKWSDHAIAKACRVDHKTVGVVRKSLALTGEIPSDDERTFTTRHGTTAIMNTAAIGGTPDPTDPRNWGDNPAVRELAEDEYYAPILKHRVPADADVIEPDAAVTGANREATKVNQANDATAALRSSKSDQWGTPLEYVGAVRRVLGVIDLDPASSDSANLTIKATRIFREHQDGLSQVWTAEDGSSVKVFLNPPFGKSEGDSNQDRWSAKLIEEFHAGRVKEAILLVNAHTGNSWFERLWAFTLCFPRRRIKFVPLAGQDESGATHGNVFVYLGPNPRGFAREFAEFGAIVREWEPLTDSVDWDGRAARDAIAS
jgi:hypothetical protein